MKKFLFSTWWMMLLVAIMCLVIFFAWRSYGNGSMDTVEALLTGIPALLIAMVCMRGIMRVYSIHHGKRGRDIEMMADEILRKAKSTQAVETPQDRL